MVKDKNNKYSFSLIVMGGTVLGLIFAGLFIVKPLVNTVTKQTDVKNMKAQELSQMEQREEVLMKLKDQEEQLKKNSDTITNALPTEEDIGRLFIQLDAMTVKNGGSLRSVSQSSAQATEGFAMRGVEEKSYVIPLEMPTYFALKQFIADSSSALRLLTVSDIKINTSESGRLVVNIIAKSYVRTE